MAGKSKFLAEFKEFAMRGNVVDMAVGVVVGGAFGKITTSIVNDIIMPIVGMFIGGINFSDWVITLPHLYGPVPETPNTLAIGSLISTILDFLIIAFVIFLFVRGINRLRARRAKQEEAPANEPAPAPEPTKEELLLTEIRDLLAKKNV
jgi:large conductance mechanosensitive channel